MDREGKDGIAIDTGIIELIEKYVNRARKVVSQHEANFFDPENFPFRYYSGSSYGYSDLENTYTIFFPEKLWEKQENKLRKATEKIGKTSEDILTLLNSSSDAELLSNILYAAASAGEKKEEYVRVGYISPVSTLHVNYPLFDIGDYGLLFYINRKKEGTEIFAFLVDKKDYRFLVYEQSDGQYRVLEDKKGGWSVSWKGSGVNAERRHYIG